MEDLIEKIRVSADFLRSKGFMNAAIGIVMGTGLGSFLHEMEIEATVHYHEIPHFPVSTVEFHKGQLVLGNLGNQRIIAMQGRFHYYEGYSMQQITFPVRVLKLLGIRHLFLSNAAGGMNPSYKKGDLILIDDHINMLPENPLRGLHHPAFGNRFVDLSQPYSAYLNNLLTAAAAENNLTLKKGVYVSVMGPNLETRAEYRHLRSIGADMVGMSTVPEVIVANHVGLPCAAISVITDECDPDNLKPVDISEIIAVAGKADTLLSQLLRTAITKIL